MHFVFSRGKTKYTTITQEPIRCKLILGDRTSHGNQLFRRKYYKYPKHSQGKLSTRRTAACINHSVWYNKHLRMETRT